MILLIKGSKEQAIQAAKDRGLELTNVQDGKHYIYAMLDDDKQGAVIKWFCETSDLLPEIGYPIGTLLWYSTTAQLPAKEA